jgi:lycopene cyclase domain-containing protein
MNAHLTYLSVDVLCVIIPLLASFHPKLQFIKQWRFFVLPLLLVATLFLVWDYFFTKAGIWSFNSRYVTGLSILNLPIEEILFFICIPYSCIFTYYCLRFFFDLSKYSKLANSISGLMIAMLIIIATFNISRLYTSVTFLLLAICFSVVRALRVKFLPNLFFAYIILLLPFLVSNGVLTGSFNNEPIVAYNNSYNLGIRILNIPVEDFFYGMLLFFMNVIVYEYTRTQYRQSK